MAYYQATFYSDLDSSYFCPSCKTYGLVVELLMDELEHSKLSIHCNNISEQDCQYTERNILRDYPNIYEQLLKDAHVAIIKDAQNMTNEIKYLEFT